MTEGGIAQRSGPTLRRQSGEIDTFADAHTGMAGQREDVGRQVVAAEQLLLDR